MRFTFMGIFALATIVCVGNGVQSDCFNVGDYFWKHLSSKTPYRYVNNRNDSVIAYEGCRAEKIWAIVRHGTRYPDVKFINRMRERLVEIQKSVIENAKEKRTTLCSSSLANISNWTPQVELANGKRLSHEGEDEMLELAERLQNRFPTLLKNEYSNSTFMFKSTATERTEKSKYYFTVGLFGRRVAKHVWSPEPVHKDPLLRFYKLCKKWLKEVHKNEKALAESETFKSLKSTQEVLKNISDRLGFKERLSFEDVALMYATCGYESASNRVGPSPWCFAFTRLEMEVMEFARDLKHYWKDGYGHGVNFEQACPLMKDMLDRFRSDEGPPAVFYFTHSGTLLKFISHLGLYYDEDRLTGDRFGAPRLWKAGRIDAFGSNLAFVLFRCGDQLKLLCLHQERPVRLPGCPKDGSLCSFDKIMRTYKRSYRNCDFDEICKSV